MRKLFIILIFIFISINCYAQLGGLPGAFTRMGFGARGISMGNALSSVITGDLVGYYNPALSLFQEDHLITLSYSFLSFDRTLNFLSYTKNFKLPKQTSGEAGVTFAIINAGVSDIDGRDIDGFHTEYYSVYDYQFLFAPSIRVSEKVALGIGFKFYYSKLFEEVTSTSLGFDVGALIKVNDKINVGLTVKDIKSENEWNTTNIYKQYGNTTKEKFPLLYTLGVSYLLPKNLGVASLEYEGSNQKSHILKAGIEYSPFAGINLRAGFDRFDFKSDDKFGNSKIMFGIGYQKSLSNYIAGLDYSFVMEPYSHKPFQTLTAIFKIR